MIKKLLSLFSISGCKWETTHTNQWMHPTQQRCKRCGKIRKIKTVRFGECVWKYSDGTESGIMEWGEQ